MPTISFDTLAYVKELITVGFTTEQAEVQVKALLNALKEVEAYRLDRMASKQDVKEIELKIAETRKDLEIKIAEVHKDLALKIADVEKEIALVRKEISESKTATIKWVAGLLIVQAGLIIGGFFAIIQFLLK